MSIDKEFAPYQESFELKELGFDEPCFGYRESTFGKEKVIIEPSGLITNSNFSKFFGETRFRLATPTFSQAFRFFREKYGLFIQPNRTIDSQGVWYYFSISTKRTDVCEGSFVYEETELACLRKLIEIVKNKS